MTSAAYEFTKKTSYAHEVNPLRQYSHFSFSFLSSFGVMHSCSTQFCPFEKLKLKQISRLFISCLILLLYIFSLVHSSHSFSFIRVPIVHSSHKHTFHKYLLKLLVITCFPLYTSNFSACVLFRLWRQGLHVTFESTSQNNSS